MVVYLSCMKELSTNSNVILCMQFMPRMLFDCVLVRLYSGRKGISGGMPLSNSRQASVGLGIQAISGFVKSATGFMGNFAAPNAARKSTCTQRSHWLLYFKRASSADGVVILP